MTVRTSNLSSLTGHFSFSALTKCIRSLQNEHIPIYPFTDFIFATGEEILIEFVIRRPYIESCGPGSSVGIATGYGLDGLGIESWCGRDFLHLSRPVLGPTQPPVQWVLGLSQG